jgi:hypothetical protein
MDRFVEECRKEWKRLGVPDAVANEMASDLEADLKEAEAEGISPEEVLGNGVFDPRTFAASWATERGVVGRPAAERRVPRSPLLVAAVAFAVVAALGGGLLLGSRVEPFAAASFPGPAFAKIACSESARSGSYPTPPPTESRVIPPRTQIEVPGCRVAAPGFPPPFAKLAMTGGPGGNRVGWILFLVGIAGMVVTLLSWIVPGRWSRRPAPTPAASG